MKYTINYWIVSIICTVVLLIFSALSLGGVGVSLCIVLLLALVTNYLLFQKLGLDTDETFFIANTISFAMFPLIVWYIGLLFNSLRWGFAITIILEIITIIILEVKKK